MKFRNPFLGAMLRMTKATRTATRKSAVAMQKRTMKATIAVFRQTLENSLPKVEGPYKTGPKTGPKAGSKALKKTEYKYKPKSKKPTIFGKSPIKRTASDDIGWPPQFRRVRQAADAQPTGKAGQFVSRSLTNTAGTRAYKLYIPSSYTGQSMPLLIMLHGCTQDPDDFAAGTRMNDIADAAACFVAYPAQTKSANAHKCWNWFRAIDQQRDRGEASIIADITRAIIDAYGCDRSRVFVAGLSAGGSMAVIMGNRYPELYAAVGVHSGLPYAAAHNLPSAMAAMRRGTLGNGKAGRGPGAGPAKVKPVIVFHGDGDKTVHPLNGEQIIEQALAHIASTERKEQGGASAGRAGLPAYTRTIYEDEARRPTAELWAVHGVAHAWSGGSANGSYTTAGGPDASKEMMRFFTTASLQ